VKSTQMFFRSALICSVVASLTLLLHPAFADEGPSLKVGSKAPAIDIEHWVSDRNGDFKHVTEFEPGKVYVIEFWATWCGPCIASMPHLSELQDEYADKGVQIISITDESLEKVKKFLERNVRGDKDKTYAELTSNYCLTADPDKSVKKSYFRAAGRTGIPCAFIVGKTGVIEWIGHPMAMEKPLAQVVNDEWDREAYLKTMEVKEKLKRKMEEAGKKFQNDDPEGALAIIEELLANKDYASEEKKLKVVKSQILILGIGGERGAAAAKEFCKENGDDPRMVMRRAIGVLTKFRQGNDVDPAIVAVASDAVKSLTESDPENSPARSILARLLEKQGDLEGAIKVQEQLIENADPRMKKQLRAYLKKLRAAAKKDDDESTEGESDKDKDQDDN